MATERRPGHPGTPDRQPPGRTAAAPASLPAAFKKSTLREYFESIVIAVILALFIRTFVVQAFKIPTGSMENNLLIGDHLLVNKFVLGPSASTLERALLPIGTIRRGDVIVFKYPEEPERDFIKRVIGLPGETLELREKKVYINGSAARRALRALPDAGARTVRSARGTTSDVRERYGPVTVPPNQYFVMGDNRDNSQDSRYWGFLPRDYVKGKALIIYWSYDSGPEDYTKEGAGATIRNLVTVFAHFFTRTRWDRMFRPDPLMRGARPTPRLGAAGRHAPPLPSPRWRPVVGIATRRGPHTPLSCTRPAATRPPQIGDRGLACVGFDAPPRAAGPRRHLRTFAGRHEGVVGCAVDRPSARRISAHLTRAGSSVFRALGTTRTSIVAQRANRRSPGSVYGVPSTGRSTIAADARQRWPRWRRRARVLAPCRRRHAAGGAAGGPRGRGRPARARTRACCAASGSWLRWTSRRPGASASSRRSRAGCLRAAPGSSRAADRSGLAPRG